MPVSESRSTRYEVPSPATGGEVIGAARRIRAGRLHWVGAHQARRFLRYDAALTVSA